MLAKLFPLALVAVLSASCAATRERTTARDGVTHIENVVYGRGSGRDLLLDLYLPTNPPAGRAGRPVVVFFHGGGWRVGDKAEVGNIVGPLTAAGFAVASANYRLSGTAIWPAPIQDGKTAVRWVRANAARHGLDPRRVGAMGYSAGGHISAMLGVTEGVGFLEDRAQGSPASASRVQAVCDVSGPVNLAIPTTHLIGKLSVLGELGGTAAEKPTLVRQADPTVYLKGGEPPFLIIQGENDGLVVTEHARRLEAALKAHGDNVTLDIVPGGGHVPMRGAAQKSEVVAFFMRGLGRP